MRITGVLQDMKIDILIMKIHYNVIIVTETKEVIPTMDGTIITLKTEMAQQHKEKVQTEEQEPRILMEVHLEEMNLLREEAPDLLHKEEVQIKERIIQVQIMNHAEAMDHLQTEERRKMVMDL